MPRRTEDFRGLTQPSRLRLLAAIQREPGLLLSELAVLTGLHENTVRDHLVVLEDEGLITRQTRHQGTRGRPPSTYHPVRDAEENREAERRVDRATRNGDLVRRIAADRADGGLGDDALHQIDTLYEHLDDAGLQPEQDEALEIELVPCPYYSLMGDQPELVCGVHSQLIEDTLHQVPGPVRLTLLERRPAPDHCRVHLGLVGAGGAAACGARE